MIPTLKRSLILIAIAAAFSSCARGTIDSRQVAASSNSSGGAATDNIDRDYQLTYDEGKEQSTLVATFNVSGDWNTTIKLSSPAQLAINGEVVSSEQLISAEGAELAGMLLPLFSPFFYLASGTHYSKTISGSSATVAFTDQLGKVFTDDLSTSPVTVSSAPSELSRSGYTISVDAGRGGDESIDAQIRQDSINGKSASAVAHGSGGTITFSSTDLASLQSGPATLTIEHSVRRPLNSVGSGSATANCTYRSRQIGLTVTP